MNACWYRSSALYSLLLLALGGAAARPCLAQWTPPTEEELKMTSQPEVPGAPAVYLFREEITNDKLHQWMKYARIKVLTERGKEYANVELRQYQGEDGDGYTISGIEGRTIHPDGTVIPFTGKPFVKVVEKSQGYKEQEKVFTLPDVEVGSIIEYRYRIRYDDDRYISPSWFVQSELYTRKAHYLWQPTDEPLISKDERGEQLTNTVAWAPILPKGFEVMQKRAPGSTMAAGQASLELNIHDVPPVPEEEFMPPIESLTYRVLFYYTPYRSVDEYWKAEGKGWSKLEEKFIGPGPKVKAAVNGLVQPGDSSEQKLRRLYAMVMSFDNTSYNRSRSAQEDKAQGLGPAKSTDDVLDRKRGGDDQMAELFVAMARAAGFKAYVMSVTNRDRSIFMPTYLSFSQLNDLVAIVAVDGKEQFFDPGQRYCPYGHLAWKHTLVSGVRQTDGGAVLAGTPGEPLAASNTKRIADLKMDEHGVVSGSVKMTWTGAPALNWRQRSLRGDTTSLKHDLNTAIEHLLPGGMEVKVSSIENLEDYEKPLVVSFDVKGAVGSPTGKRLLVPADIFETNEKPTFPHEKRDLAVYFEYPSSMQDAVRYTFPAGFSVESMPASEKVPMENQAFYSLTTESTASSVTTRRDFELGGIYYTPEKYPTLRGFYNKLQTKDQEPAVLKIVAQAATGAGQ